MRIAKRVNGSGRSLSRLVDGDEGKEKRGGRAVDENTEDDGWEN